MRRILASLFYMLAACASAGSQAASPLLAILDQFVAPGIPALGPDEPGPTPRSWPDPTSMPDLPGRGLAQHPMLYVGEGYNTIFLVNHGKVVWTYSTGKGGEIDDVWMLSNGHILFARQFHVEEVTPQKEVVCITTRRRGPKCIPANPSASIKSCWCKMACRRN